MVLVGTVLVMVLALVFGVWMARDRWVDLGIRPLLDAGQTIPPFVYLIPVLALFGPSPLHRHRRGHRVRRPAAIKLVADGVKGVSPTTIEAGRSTGQTTWQEITKVQLPMAKGSLVLATNQGLLYVLAMVVIGGLVGAGRARLRRRARHLAQRGVGQGRRRRPDHRAARRDARPDHPRRRRRTPRRRSRHRAAPSTSGCPSARPARPTHVFGTPHDPPTHSEEKHHEDCQKPRGPAGRPRRRRQRGALRLRWRRVHRRGDRGQRGRRPPSPEASAATSTWPSTRGSATRPAPTSSARSPQDQLGLHGQLQGPQGGRLLAGLRHRRGRRRDRGLGPPRPREEVLRRPGRRHGRGLRAAGQRRHHRLVRAAVARRGAPRHPRLREPQQVRRTSSPPPSPAARASSSAPTRPTSSSTRRS